MGVKKSTNIAAMYGELGRMLLRVVRKLIKFKCLMGNNTERINLNT